ncbi:DEAD/DEAH box helicase [Subtercola sp. PAMC28395]|uniref:DEAD/DEAH box helicase n=1 Tax=Subtercola sp. PAMC28395 TaxID=2846775 RepID=UPI00352C0DDA
MLGTRKNASITVSPLASVRLEAVTLPSGDLQLTPVVVFGAAQPAGTGGAATRAAADATSSEGAGAAARADQRAATATTSGSVGAARKNAASVVGSPAEGDSSNRAAGVGSHGSTGAGSIGDHGLYVFELAPLPTVRLAPLAGALSGADAGPSGGLGGGLSAEVRAMLRRASDIVVPAAEVAEFLEDFYPTLRRAVDVTSSDATIVLPEIEPPLLVLTARFRPKNVLALDWAWQYGGDRKPTRLPLHAGDDEGDEAAAGHGSESRDTRAEQAILARVAGAFTAEADPEEFFDPAVPLNSSLVLQGYEAAVFTEKTLPSIEAVDGVRVDVVGKRPDYRELTGEPEMTITTVESDKRDWFDLGIIVNMGGYQIPFGPLFKALSRGEKKLLMVDKTYLSLEHPAFDRLRELLTEANSLDEWETGTRISRYQASLWADLEELADETVQAVAWRAAVSGLNEVTSIRPVPVPLSVQATLRPYQQEGFQWLAFLHEHGLGGVLADDMGLGKTLQTLTLIAHARTPTLPALGSGTPGVSLSQPPPAPDARPPFLVVAPTSVVSNWVAEATRFTPGLEVRGVTTTQSKGRLPLAELAAGADVVVTSYALFRLDFEVYQALEWSGLILDEAQFIKNHTSKIHRCATDFDAPFKLAITGTPLENNLMELWSLFAVVAPGLFPSAQKFTEGYVRPIERAQGDELLPKLRRRIRPLLMRRTKELVAPELPAKQEQVLQIALAPAHRALYDTFFQRERQKLLGLVEDLDRNRFIVFRSLTLLRMLSLDASLIDEKYSHIPSSKLDALFEQLDDVIVEGHRALIFSQFTSFLGKAATRMAAAGIAYEYLDGSTTKRADVIARFKTGTAPVFLISLKAGGFGLNLTEADYVFLLDPWWNPATESQAIDRTHRIGQSKSVNVYRLVAGGTIEEKVMALKEQKAKLFDTVMDDDAVFSSALTADDIRDLLDV